MPNVIDLIDTTAEQNRVAQQRTKNRLYAQLSRVFVAHEMNVSADKLLAASRSSAAICQARQAAMYLTHVVFGISFTAVGIEFGRDRSTVAHACEQVEWRREDPQLDAVLNRLEWQLRAATQTPSRSEPDNAGPETLAGGAGGSIHG